MTQDNKSIGKSAVLKARVEEALEDDFLAVCAALGRTPATQLRELVRNWVAYNRRSLEDPVIVNAYREEGYDFGAWRVKMRLRESADMSMEEAAIPFALPRLPNRRIHPDKGFAVATPAWDATGSGLSGIFVEGVWEGHIYSNGIAEEANPTSVDAVKDALRRAVMERINFRRSQDQ